MLVPPSSRRPLDRRRMRGRSRQAAFRARQKAGVAIYAVPIDGAVIDLLVRLRWLRDQDATSRRAVAKAIADLLADAVTDNG